MKICLINFNSFWKNKEKNIEKKEKLINQAILLFKDIDVIVFPELSLTGYVLDSDNLELAENIDWNSIKKMQEIAKKYNVWIVFWFIEKNNNEKPFNSCIFIDKNWDVLATYSKNHLYSESVEPDFYSAWKWLSIFEFMWYKCWFSICFDVRYPRLFEEYKKNWVECIFNPFAWTDWRNKPSLFQTLNKSRSHENQFFMVSVDNLWIDENASYSWNAIISNPFWEDISKTKGWIFHFWEINKEDIKSIRNALPLENSFKEKYIIVKN